MPIKSSESLILSRRRKSLHTPRSPFMKSIRRSSILSRSCTIHETIHHHHPTPTMISKPTTASIMKQRSKSIHSVQPINPPKKPNELPLENRASRLKAEYLAKKRANEANAAENKSRMIGIKQTTSIMTSQSLMIRRKTSCTPIQRSGKSGNIRKSNSLNIDNRLNTFERNILLSSNDETPKSINRRCERQKNSVRKLSKI